MTPSVRQQAVYREWQNGNPNLLIEAVAGSGKTTLLLNLLRMCRWRTLFVAFNKGIKTEIQDYIDKNGLTQGKAMTMHALGLMAIRKRYGRFKLNNNKNWDILKLVRNNKEALFNQIPFADRMKVSYMLMDMNDVSRIYMTHNIHEIKERMIAMDKPFYTNDILRELWLETLRIRDMYYTKTPIEIDFVDMIYVPVRENLYIPIKPTYLFIDEAQDLNGAQHKLLDNLINQGDIERWVAVGDRNQAIYGFSGAHESSFDLFKEKDNVVELPLDICYRLPVDILGQANEVYDIMQGFKQNPGIIGEVDTPASVKNDSMVVCRNSAPLFQLYFQLIAQGKKTYIKGEDILGSVNSFIRPYKKNLIEYIVANTTDRIDKLKGSQADHDRIEAWRLEQSLEMLQNMVMGGFISYRDKGQDLLDKLKILFDDSGGGIILCTIHKSKGLEHDVVYILNEKLIPSKHAKSAQQQKQEMNLKYVARTRAKEEMYYLNI